MDGKSQGVSWELELGRCLRCRSPVSRVGRAGAVLSGPGVPGASRDMAEYGVPGGLLTRGGTVFQGAYLLGGMRCSRELIHMRRYGVPEDIYTRVVKCEHGVPGDIYMGGYGVPGGSYTWGFTVFQETYRHGGLRCSRRHRHGGPYLFQETVSWNK